jgi:hypothetical protein
VNSKSSNSFFILFAASCLVSAAWMGSHSRDGDGRESGPVLGADAPAGVRFVTVALGGFRGILADILWLRASDLQDEGRIFEVAQLADWITMLQPRYPEVWAYHAWNMAYNITSVLADPADRWHWVRNGIRLLRDEGIPSNPHDPKLYWELGWMFYDKVGGKWDEATLFYRVSWAREMGEIVGTNPDSVDAIRRLAAAGLDPVQMKAVDEAYGPLDWRLPESHALYWGACGRPYQRADSPWCSRLVWMGLIETMKGGSLAFSPAQRIYQQGPRLDVAVKGIQWCSREGMSSDPLIRAVMINFLREATLYLEAFEKRLEAEAALTELKRMPDYHDGEVALDEFIRRQIQAEIKAWDDASRQECVVRFLTRSESWRRLDEAHYAVGYERLARLYHEAWIQTGKSAVVWDTLRAMARERSLREMPDAAKTPPQSP